MIISKRCPKCGETLLVENFYKSGKNFSSYCKACMGLYNKEEDRKAKRTIAYRKWLSNEKNKEKANKDQKEMRLLPENQSRFKGYRDKYRSKNYNVILWSNAKKRAREQGLIFDIEPSDIQIPEKCPVLEIPICLTNTRVQGNSPSIDRIDPNRGYVKGNVRVISFRANTLKSDATKQEIQKIIT